MHVVSKSTGEHFTILDQNVQVRNKKDGEVSVRKLKNLQPVLPKELHWMQVGTGQYLRPDAFFSLYIKCDDDGEFRLYGKTLAGTLVQIAEGKWEDMLCLLRRLVDEEEEI